MFEGCGSLSGGVRRDLKFPSFNSILSDLFTALLLYMKSSLEEIKDKIIYDSKERLRVLNESPRPNPDASYRDFLESLSFGKCRICKCDIEVVYAEETLNSYTYKFSCGHSVSGVTIIETIVVRESIKIRKTPSGIKKFVLETVQGWFPSNRIDLSPDGVRKIRIVDRETDYYREEVVDVKTGRLIRSVEERLSNHRK